MTWIARHRTTVGFAACILVVAGGFLALGLGLAAQRDAAKANQRAILVGCVLLTNVVVQSGANQQNESTQLFVKAIQRVMTPEEREHFKRAMDSQSATGISVPPCKRISEHPEEVKAVPLPTPTPTPSAPPG